MSRRQSVRLRPVCSEKPLALATVKDLGLKLEASKGPVETIVIEHAEKPSAN